MQSTQISLLLVLVPLAIAEHYGPQNCVSIARTAKGSCALKTECKGVDTSNFEFAFSCQSRDGSFTRHSFGLGGFDDEEEYDTEVKCLSCQAPHVLASESAKEKVEEVVKIEKDKAIIKQEPTKEEQFR